MEWRRRLAAAVADSGRKQSAIAADAAITAVSLSRILHGQTASPGFTVVARIAHAAGVTVGWVLGEEGFDLTPKQLGIMQGAVQSLLDGLESLERGALLRLHRSLSSEPPAAMAETHRNAEEEYAWRSLIDHLRSATYRDRVANTRSLLLGVFGAAQLAMSSGAGGSCRLVVRDGEGREQSIGIVHAAEAQAIVATVNLLLDASTTEASQNERRPTGVGVR